MKTKKKPNYKYVPALGFAIIFLMLGLSLTRCYYDSNEEINPSINNNCDVTDYSYATGVQLILQDNCIGCHGSSYASSGGGIDLRTYSAVKTNINGVLGSIKYSSGYSRMPKNSTKLIDCQITIIQSWKDNGFPQ